MDSKKILVINCGSSSLKYEVFQMPEKESLGKGLVERIGIEGANISQKSPKGKFALETEIPNHTKAMELVARFLTDPERGLIKSMDEIEGIGHRLVHAGEDFATSVVITDEVIAAVEKNTDLAPLHNPANLIGVNEATALLPEVKQVGVFDTAFHQTMEPSAYLYSIPRKFYDDLKVRKYGFHGTSHRFVSKRACEFLNREVEDTNVIVCHLGNGASICAVEAGKSIDTSMGFTPLAGVCMGTRSGDIDPSIIFYLMNKGYSADEVSKILNKESGLIGLSGISSDLRDVEAEGAKGNKAAQETLENYARRVRQYIGGYMASMPRTDVIAFCGGVGEWGAEMKWRVLSKLQSLGIFVNEEKVMNTNGVEGIISEPWSKVQVVVIPTNEELQIAMDTYELIFK